MQDKTPIIAIRLIGFSVKEEDTFFNVLAVARERGYRYLCLKPGSLQDPDMFIVNAEALKALATLSDCNPGDAQPVLLIGKTAVSLPYPAMPRPIRWRKLFEILDELVDQRQLLLSTLTAHTAVAVPERRRRERLDMDLTDPAEYVKMRRPLPAKKGILIVDKDTRFYEYVTNLMARHDVVVNLAQDEDQVALQNQNLKHALVLINTSTPEIDPYDLCEIIKSQNVGLKSVVILLTEVNYPYNMIKAKQVGCDGFINKPLSRKLVLSTIQKFLQLH